MTNDYRSGPASLFASHAREPRLIQTAVDTCPKCDYSMDEYEGPRGAFRMCCNCEFRVDVPEAERDAAEARSIAHWVGGEEPK